MRHGSRQHARDSDRETPHGRGQEFAPAQARPGLGLILARGGESDGVGGDEGETAQQPEGGTERRAKRQPGGGALGQLPKEGEA